jgi:nicotinate-nucleotide adenylyltransferase
MKVGLLGGSFNPPHQGHIHISLLATKKLGLNQVWWIPTLQNPFKEKSLYENYQARLRKCQELTKLFAKIRVKEIDEIRTIALVNRLQSQYKNIEFFWLMGADGLEKFHRWKNFKNIIRQIPLIIFSRENFLSKIKKTKAWKFIAASNYKIFYTKNLDVSSSKIRKYL